MQINNETPFEVMSNPGFDEEGREIVTVIVKGTFGISEGQTAEPVDRDKQIKIVMADEYWGAPGDSPVRYESDLAMFKPGTDLILLGSAQAADGAPARHFEVSFSVGNHAVARSLHFWSKLDRLPLHTIDWKFEKDKWTVAKKPRDGLCFFPKSVPPRVKCAGTYDENWQKDRAPFLPADFDYRFFQAAYPDLICQPYLRGNEPVQVTGACPGPPVNARLPGIRIEIDAFLKAGKRKAAANLDTVVVEPELRRLVLVWRALFKVDGPPTDVRGFVVKQSRLAS